MPKTARTSAAMPNDLSNFFMPFTANRAFKQRPRLISRAKGMYYFTPEGREVMDAAAGLWCTNAGHNHERIVKAIQTQAQELDFAPSFQFSHPLAFQAASRNFSLIRSSDRSGFRSMMISASPMAASCARTSGMTG